MSSKNALPTRTPSKTPVKAGPKTPASTGKQQSILGFFNKKQALSSSPLKKEEEAGDPSPVPVPLSSPTKPTLPPPTANCLREMKSHPRLNINTHPPVSQSSSDASDENLVTSAKSSALPNSAVDRDGSRRSKRSVNYAESDDDDDDDDGGDDVGLPVYKNKSRTRKSRVIEDDDDEDADFHLPDEDDFHLEDDELDGFVVPDDESDTEAQPLKKRKRVASVAQSRKKTAPPTTISSPLKKIHVDSLGAEVGDGDGDVDVDSLGVSSTCHRWRFDPRDTERKETRAAVAAPERSSATPKPREKAHKSEPEQRYPWLAKLQDANRNPIGHADYDPSTIYIPPAAWAKFTPFEKQYWEIKQKLYDTVVFFKKGKFYELYENDATIGHQQFDLKLTDRVNMRMVGVPESSLDMWTNQFIAKGYKVARVDQVESALGKEMRERDDKGKKGDSIIRRELSCVLTAGTLVEGSMLQDDMATYCVAIKETLKTGESDGGDDTKGGMPVPVYGIAFVDASTGSFHLSQFEDDVDRTKFETFVAQVNPRELILEKGCLSVQALRILKNNTAPTTLWNYKKSGDDFWDAATTQRELVGSEYFPEGAWPPVLARMCDGSGRGDHDEVLSALGALIQYLRTLKMEGSLLSQGNFSTYSPIQRDGTLILDGKTLMNLEVFANTLDQGAEGTLFQLLNRCVTPFGKRLFRQWVCHPLCNVAKLNDRLDAVEVLNGQAMLRDQFTSQMTKMPDLERLCSRIHAGSCRPDDFVRVLDGFEQMEYTLSLLRDAQDQLRPAAGRSSPGLLVGLLEAMPDLSAPLTYWKTAFDWRKAREERVFVPQPGIVEEYDESWEACRGIRRELEALLAEQKTKLGCRTVKFTDVGKEIYQIEVPKATKVPGNWRQMSATSSVKRYYFGALTDLVRWLQEAEEKHSQMLKVTASRFFRRFDEDHETWLRAIRVLSQLDCLLSLAKASAALGEPSCRPVLVDDGDVAASPGGEERGVVYFEELRHPCMVSSVGNFVSNTIELGGPSAARLNLLTGANAAGKSTILRMTCVAVIMAQIGCWVPAVSARLTPVDRIMSRLGANDNIFASQSTFFVELSETKKILAEATPRSLVILDELGRGTSSYDGVAVAQAVLHHVASHVRCLGFFATHYHSLAGEFASHPEIRARRMQIAVDEPARRITFLYRLEDGVAEGSFGMHCAAMCGLPERVIRRAEVAAREWEYTGRVKARLEAARAGGQGAYVPLGVWSDVAAVMRNTAAAGGEVDAGALAILLRMVDAL